MLPIHHNMLALNAERQFNINTKSKAKRTEKLSSGYRINRAADDAAGLAISEKMRRQIRGFHAGTENAMNGVSWVQIGEGALNEAHDIMQRMNELTIKAQNGTWTETDRAFMESEFDQLQSELDRISDTTVFNELNIFREHEPVYDQICGNIQWDHAEPHTILAGRNKLIVNYRETLDSPQQTITLEVPPGTYTTHELIDELDDAAGLLGPIHMELTEKGYCNLNLEGNEMIDTISGDLAYLLFDTYNGAGYGALIGTTGFPDENSRLEVVQGQNDYMEFEIEYFDGSGTDKVKIDLIPDSEGNVTKSFTKKELMDRIDAAVPANSGLKADHHGDAIMLSSELGIVTGFKGNMFTLENKDPKYDSTFYDNIQHGYVWQDHASVVGGAVLTTDTRDKEHNRYYIDSTNNKLVLQPNLTQTPTTITITENTKDGYTASQMVAELNKQFEAAGLKNEVQAFLVQSKNPAGTVITERVGDDSVIFQGVEIRTVKQGPDAIVNIDKAQSTAYDTLFTIKDFNSYGSDATDAKVDNEENADHNAYARSSATFSGSDVRDIRNGVNDSFIITLKSTSGRATNSSSDYSKDFVIDFRSSGKGNLTINTIISNINDQINNTPELKGRVVAKLDDSGHIRIEDNEDGTLDKVNDAYLNWNTTISLKSNGGNDGYRTLFQEKYTYDVHYSKNWKNQASFTIPSGGLTKGMKISIDNGREILTFYQGETASDIANRINSETPITFSDEDESDLHGSKNFTARGDGSTRVDYWASGSAKGDSEKQQGLVGYTKNAPAELEIGPELKDSMKVDGTNDAITLTLNGRTETVHLAHKDNYTKEELRDALQDAIDAKFGDGMGGAIVKLDGSQLVLTSRLPSWEDGKKTSISIAGKGSSTFFDSLTTVETAASCTSSQKLLSSITLTDGVDDVFTFNYSDSTGSHTVTLDLTNATESFNADSLVSRINERLQNPDDPTAVYKGKVTAINSGGYLKLTTTEKGSDTHVEFTTGSGSVTNANPKALFGDLGQAVAIPAKIMLDKDIKNSATITGSPKTFKFQLDNHTVSVDINSWSNRGEFVQQLNDYFTANSLKVKAYLSGSKLCLEKTEASHGSLSMTYGTGGTVMQDLFGTEQRSSVDGVDVSASGNTLTINVGTGHLISVNSETGGGLVIPKKATGYYSHEQGSGFHSAKFSTVTSTTLNSNGVVLDRWNKDLQFTFQQGTTKTDVSIELTESAGGNPTSLEDIKKELQQKIDAALGAGAIEVLLANNKLSLKSMKAGNQFRFSKLGSKSTQKEGGGFFHHVMCKYTPTHVPVDDPTDVNGEQKADKIFAQGRHDVVTELTKLKPGVSDTLILDLTYIPDPNENKVIDAGEEKGQQTITLTLKLDPNVYEEDFYNADELKEMIQKKLDEAIKGTDVQEQAKKLGIQLHEGLIKVDVGIHDTEVYGNKDKVSISFNITENPDIATPVEGFFYIDGVRGNAAYETFYYTEGELIPAYIIGTKDLSDGVQLGENDTDLSFVVDGQDYTVKLEGGKSYTAEELVKKITEEFEAQGIPLAAEITKKGALKISHKRMGSHTIEKVTGSAREELFFLENADNKPDQERYIRISSNDGDWIDLYSPRFSTMMLNINSICISDVKYAEKATNRLKTAITTVSELRNTFGVIQNRLEHAINNNRNKEENTQAAESRIRDADVADEMMAFSNLSIIQQAGQAVLAQANHSRDGLLSLLQ